MTNLILSSSIALIKNDNYEIPNIDIGGAWGSTKGIDDEAFPQVMELDYVRVYQNTTD